MRKDVSLDCIREIGGYYASCRHLFGNTVAISKSMLSYALHLQGIEHLDPLLKKLRKSGAILSIGDQMVTFSRSFIQGEQ